MKMRLYIVASMVAFLALSALFTAEEMEINLSSIPIYDYEITNIYPHDNTAFTEGLVCNGQNLYESTGRYGNSTLRQVDLGTGNILKLQKMPAEYFGEGITIWEDRIIQLTWRSMTGFVYDKQSFNLISNFHYPGEGWGITTDGQRLIMSDGTDTLHFLNPITFEDLGSIKVRNNNTPVSRLNELEYIKGKIYANVWMTNGIAIISLETGEVSGWIDLQGLVDREQRLNHIDVLNGIAYEKDRDRLLVTGKLWPELFEIEIRTMNISS